MPCVVRDRESDFKQQHINGKAICNHPRIAIEAYKIHRLRRSVHESAYATSTICSGSFRIGGISIFLAQDRLTIVIYAELVSRSKHIDLATCLMKNRLTELRYIGIQRIRWQDNDEYMYISISAESSGETINYIIYVYCGPYVTKASDFSVLLLGRWLINSTRAVLHLRTWKRNKKVRSTIRSRKRNY